MALTLKPKTEERIQLSLARGGFQTPDDLVCAALEMYDAVLEGPVDEQEARDIQTSLEQMNRGEMIPLEEVAAPLEAKYGF